MTKRKTITLTDQQDQWVKAQIVAGKYTNDSEYVRDLIRQDQNRNSFDDAIRAALVKGEQSGEARSFNGDRFKRTLADRHAEKLT